jgi:hypothetical protein
MTGKRKQPAAGPQPVVCPQCKQRGDERPGFRRRQYPEAVGFDDGGMTPVDSFACNACGYGFVVPVGSIEVRQP